MAAASVKVRSVLVPNRGEIALRVFRACRDLGIRAIGVYSEIDRGAPWLQMADDAFFIGPSAPAESYLNFERVLAVAGRANVDAIHPGYGFLSENADFARAVEDAGLVWVGPSPDAIVRMGDKLSARAAAAEANVPLVPGTDQATDDPAEVRAFADAHGYPIAIKAAFGGGGRGLRVVDDPKGLDDALEGAQREAKAAFGRGEVYVERYLRRPRHIEAQILADTHGTCLFLGERDCSSQRRHQKLIEEAPAPGLDPEVRKALGEAAVAVSQQVGYVNAGTVEFLYEDGVFYFLEMNARLQVEHPVTELVTGIDLVHWQLRIARGERLPWTQDDVTLRGHAIELRINAEQPSNNFSPATGTVTRWRPPQGPGVRLDAGVETDFVVPPTYDSLLGKLIAYGTTRDDARRVAVRACDEFQIEGVPTTLTFHQMALEHPDFVDGRVSTVSVEHEWDLSALPADGPAMPGEAGSEPSRTYAIEVDGRTVRVAIFDQAEEQRARPGRRRQQRTGSPAGSMNDADLASPMQGTVVKVAAEVGVTVAAGDMVLVLEAMKMENHVVAHRDGVLSAIHVAAGDVVQQGEKLFTIDSE